MKSKVAVPSSRTVVLDAGVTVEVPLVTFRVSPFTKPSALSEIVAPGAAVAGVGVKLVIANAVGVTMSGTTAVPGSLALLNPVKHWTLSEYVPGAFTMFMRSSAHVPSSFEKETVSPTVPAVTKFLIAVNPAELIE
jgi:hypothetical protein